MFRLLDTTFKKQQLGFTVLDTDKDRFFHPLEAIRIHAGIRSVFKFQVRNPKIQYSPGTAG
jgi:hypothetical protein